MIARNDTVRLLGALLCGLVAGGPVAAFAAAEEVAPAAQATPAPEDDPVSLRDAVALVAQHFRFSVVGASRLGTDAPAWPAEDQGPEAMVGALLKDYGYIVVLKPQARPGAPRELQTVFIVGQNHASADNTPKPAISPPSPMTARTAPIPAPAAVAAAPAAPSGHRPAWAPPPSTVVRALTKLATTNSPNGTPDAQPTTPMPNPAENAAAMAALTRSAQSGLGSLVTGLRQACPNPKGC